MAQVAVADVVQLPADGAGKREGHFRVNIGGTDIYLPASVITDTAGNSIDGATALLAGTERGLITRAITQGGSLTPIVGSITTATSVVGPMAVGAAGNITVTIATGTAVGVRAVFESTNDGGPTQWFFDPGNRSDNNNAESDTGVLAASTLRMWNFAAEGITHFRVRATGWTSGSAAVIITAGSGFFQPVVSAIPPRPGTSTITAPTVAAANTNGTILAANPLRQGATIYNDSIGNMLVKYGATSSATSFTDRLPPQARHTVDFGYVGIIDGQWDIANGVARVTEITA